MAVGARFPAAVATVAAAAAAAALALGACRQPRTACGDPSPGGGPPVISTKDGELCAATRLRVVGALEKMPDLEPQTAESLRDRTWGWEDAKTVEAFLRRVRSEAGDAVADAIGRAVEDVRAHSTRPLRADCSDEERCLVRGAALGARIAFDDAAEILWRMRGGRVRIGGDADPR